MYLPVPCLSMLLGQGPEQYLCLYPGYQGTLYHLAHPGRHCVTRVPLDHLQCYLQFESCPHIIFQHFSFCYSYTIVDWQ